MTKSRPDWKNYERLVAQLVARQLSTEYCVTPNARVFGAISGRNRQIDVLIDLRHDTDNSRRIIIDAKARSRRIDVTHVEAFRGLMEDVGATHGYLVCPLGHTPAAERRAQDAVSIRLLPLDRLDDFDPSVWPDCIVQGCRGGKVFWSGYPSIDMHVLPLSGTSNEMHRISFVHYVGKCDRCHHFHVRCTTCLEMLSPPYDSDDDGHQCRCRKPWFWLGSIETDASGRKSAELHLVNALYGEARIETVDRRSM
ncbi:restriction endonuclease [Ralstonia solanacearum]|uniref:restriction endonuclease n=1 Tax=Ralstonia solanacearum TaxID=305 RepID=UPI0009C0E6AB